MKLTSFNNLKVSLFDGQAQNLPYFFLCLFSHRTLTTFLTLVCRTRVIYRPWPISPTSSLKLRSGRAFNRYSEGHESDSRFSLGTQCFLSPKLVTNKFIQHLSFNPTTEFIMVEMF